MNDSLYNLWVSNGANNTRTEVTRTFYDNQQAPINVLAQTNLKKRVSSVYYQDTFANLDTGAHTNYMHATHYAYDVHGNVNTLIQDVPELNSVNNQYKKINYFYDLVSNKVNLIIFDKGKNDEYQHRYTYDADNRVTQMETSRDGINWDNDASYEYYDHGPLARTELGDNKVQGLDYVYTIQGWIKGVNSNTMNETRDPGRDGDIGLTSNEHAYVAKDAFGYSLSYFEGDYQSIQSFSTTDFFVAKTTGSNLVNARNDLWNGNIGSMVTCLPQASTYSSSKTITPEAFGNAYKYDQLNRIAQSRVFTNISYSQNEWLSSGSANPQAFGTNYTYDPMGNILSQKRNGAGTTGNPLDLDNLVYGYNTNSDGLISNRLYQVRDSVSATNYTDDIDNQDTLNKSIAVLETANNYGYDELGNLKHDKQEQIARIDWTVYGKIKRIVRTSGSSKPNLVFGYDASGNRLWKKVITPGTADSIKTFYYVRDAQGNEMCHYIKYKDSANRIMFVSEEHSLYGSSRVGVDSRRDTLYMAGNYHPAWMDSGKFYRALGLKNYELSNHLGNVLVTVSDKPIHKEISGNIYFEAEITTINDYYPFGSSLNTRSFSAGSGFRFGFNGKENFDQYQDYGFRIYYSELGKFLSTDPIIVFQQKYQELSSYQFASNTPICAIDLDGLEARISIAGIGNGNNYEYSHIVSFRVRAKALKTQYGFDYAEKINTGEALLNVLKKYTKEQGSILRVVTFSHGGYDGLFLDENNGMYTRNFPNGGSKEKTVRDLATAIELAQIKFDKNAVWTLAACNTANTTGNANFATEITMQTGVTTVGATGYVGPEIVNGNETGRLVTDGKFLKIERKFQLSYKIKGKVVVKSFTSKSEATSFNQKINNSGNISKNITKTDLGNIIDPGKQ